jgi:CubicO group peptidase (beta-lactamase class C family)
MTLKMVLLFFVAAVHAAAAYGAEGDKDIARKLDAYLQTETKERGFTGAVLVARGGKVLFSKGYGYADLEWKVPNTPQTRFRIASMTKSFMATGILMLREQGKLELEDSICKYIDPCPQSWQAVNLRHLLTNTSGIKNHFWGSEADVNAARTREQILDFMRSKPLEFEPGTYVNYGNSAWYLLGVVMEKITGKSYDQVLKELIFDPLGMRDTGHDDREQILERRARGYHHRDGRLVNASTEHISRVAGAASLYSTVEDLYKFDRALSATSLLPQAALDLMFTSVEVLWWQSTEQANYGLGWWLLPKSEHQKHFMIRGTGGMSGFLTGLLRFPEEDVTIVMIENCDSAQNNAVAGIEAITFGGEPPPPPPPPPTFTPEQLREFERQRREQEEQME